MPLQLLPAPQELGLALVVVAELAAAPVVEVEVETEGILDPDEAAPQEAAAEVSHEIPLWMMPSPMVLATQ